MSDTTSPRHRQKAIALLTRPASVAEATARLRKAHRSLIALDASHRTVTRKTLRVTDAVIAELRAIRETEGLTFVLHTEVEQVRFAALHLRHLALAR